MKFIKNASKILVISATLVSSMALAGNISSGGDNVTVFSCSSPANVDSALRVVGMDYEGSGKIDMKIWVGQNLTEQDRGVFNKSLGQYKGDAFSVDLNTNGRKQTGHITAKKPNKILQVGQSDALECQTYRVNANQ
jgi:hypothetical protein